jgi:hypothetical protein
MSLLTMIQPAAVKLGLYATPPGSAASNPDGNIQQLVALLNEAGQELLNRHPWQVARNEANFTTVAATSQGNIITICAAPANETFAYIVNESMWDRTTRRPLFGPKSPAEWQQLNAQFVQGPWYQYTIRANQILFLPVPAAGDAIYFEWMQKEWATDSTGATPKQSMTADTDIALLDERILTLECIWRWKSAKGLAYADDFKKADDAIQDAMARDGGKPVLSLTGTQTDVYPGTIVPAGNWQPL